MEIQWKMTGINRNIIIQKKFHLLSCYASQCMFTVPKQSMMNNKEIYLMLHCFLNGLQITIYSSTNLCNDTIVRNLQTIVCTWIILDIVRIKDCIDVIDYV